MSILSLRLCAFARDLFFSFQPFHPTPATAHAQQLISLPAILFISSFPSHRQTDGYQDECFRSKGTKVSPKAIFFL
jgi:hypothetical protein